MPELGRGGGEVIWAMPERNRFFLWEVVPKDDMIYHDDRYNGDDEDDIRKIAWVRFSATTICHQILPNSDGWQSDGNQQTTNKNQLFP